MTQGLPQSMATLYLQPSGLYEAASTGAIGEVAVVVPITDAVCVDDLDENGNETTTDAQALAQDVYHIFIEVLGSNLDDPNRGLGVDGFASANSTQLASLPSICDSQLQKDTRIAGSKTTLTMTSTNPLAFSMSTEIVADGTIIPLDFTYTAQTGLVMQ
jgi:hypothetical protein